MAIFTVFTRHPGQHNACQNVSDANEPRSESPAATTQEQEQGAVSVSRETDDPLTMAITPSLSQLAASGLLDAKDRRAYEVARQRRKKPTDRRKARDQNASGDQRSWHCAGRPRTVTHPGLVAMKEGGGDIVVVDESDSEDNEAKPCIEKVNQTGIREVLLEDLIQTAKVRREKAGDFELVPKVRPVLALDDFEGRDAPEFDEPWEHVYSSSSSNTSDEEVNAIKHASYAQVVSTSKN